MHHTTLTVKEYEGWATSTQNAKIDIMTVKEHFRLIGLYTTRLETKTYKITEEENRRQRKRDRVVKWMLLEDNGREKLEKNTKNMEYCRFFHQ